MKETIRIKCWVCRLNDADTGEHKTKRSDLRAVFGVPTQAQPLYYHDMSKPNQLIRSLDAKILKSQSRICAKCNNERTKPHDLAWERLSNALRERSPPILEGSVVRGCEIFPYDTAREMLNVHLYFLKVFGCMILEGGASVPIDVSTVGDAIVRGAAHPDVYLQFGLGDGKSGWSNLAGIRAPNGHILAFWLYRLDTLAVNVMFAQNARGWKGLSGMWHPQFGTNKLVISNLGSPH